MFYGFVNTYVAGITFICYQNNGSIGFLTLSKHIKRLRVQVSIPFIAKYIAIISLSVIGGSHLKFSKHKVDEMANISDKNTII